MCQELLPTVYSGSGPGGRNLPGGMSVCAHCPYSRFGESKSESEMGCRASAFPEGLHSIPPFPEPTLAVKRALSPSVTGWTEEIAMPSSP